jgi:chain length determinant protein (polysaccharide antigen chain regulator)
MSVNHQIDNDEIDLMKLFDIFWRGKWLIAIPSLLVALATFLYLSFAPINYSVTLQVTPLSEQIIDDYASLNNIPGSSTPIYVQGSLVGYEDLINAQKLMRAFRENFFLGTHLTQAIEESDPVFHDFIGSAQEKRLVLSKQASKFSLETTYAEEDSNKILAFQISSETEQIDFTRQILQRYIELAALDIRLQNLISIVGLKKKAASNLNYERQKLESEIDNAKQTYFTSLKIRIAILREQAQIARALNLADPAQNLTINTLASTDENTDRDGKTENLYRNGYRALEAEINLLQNRDKSTWKVFMSSYAQMDAKMRELNSNNYTKLLNDALAAAPLSDADQFKPADFDLDNLLIEPKTNKPLIMILATWLAAVLAGLFVLMRHFMRAPSTSEI